jgi:hypothetical protein
MSERFYKSKNSSRGIAKYSCTFMCVCLCVCVCVCVCVKDTHVIKKKRRRVIVSWCVWVKFQRENFLPKLDG